MKKFSIFLLPALLLVTQGTALYAAAGAHRQDFDAHLHKLAHAEGYTNTLDWLQDVVAFFDTPGTIETIFQHGAAEESEDEVSNEEVLAARIEAVIRGELTLQAANFTDQQRSALEHFRGFVESHSETAEEARGLWSAVSTELKKAFPRGGAPQGPKAGQGSLLLNEAQIAQALQAVKTKPSMLLVGIPSMETKLKATVEAGGPLAEKAQQVLSLIPKGTTAFGPTLPLSLHKTK